MDNEIQIGDLMEVDILQRIQDAFSQMTGMASITTDVDGNPVTQPSNFTEFCMGYIRNSKVGCIRCEQCDKAGAMKTLLSGEPTTYSCHAGLIDYAAPIMAGNKLVGCFIGGQVQRKKLTRDEVNEVARVVNVDADGLWEAASKVKVIPEDKIDKSAQFLYTIANIISDMAYSKHLAIEAGKEMERAGNMKADFLANMSHEIRTPMNAVIGMAEMALREDLSPVARDYITQIRSSGKALLTIINDILDFSKIESGKMDINVVEYEPLTIINEVINILLMRLEKKNIDLIIDIDPRLPKKLMGDDIRLKQIIINLANNAVKFTREGYVKIKVSYDTLFGVGIMLKVSVEDTGIGIKEVDKVHLFESFQQIDSKRNRNIEGTGLGLAITKQLLKLMNGTIQVDSEYEKGSTFTISLPQRTVLNEPCVKVDNPKDIAVTCCIRNGVVKDEIKKDLAALHVRYEEFTTQDRIKEFAGDGKAYIVAEELSFNKEMKKFMEDNPQVELLLVTDSLDYEDVNLPNVTYARKPVYAQILALWFNGHELTFMDNEEAFSDFLFTAPEAEILVVDDNAINLTVTKGLLEPMEMKIDTALSGKVAIDMVSEKHYDLIFMDHMMPEIDGVETTRIIRRLHPEYNDVPIIALTANAVDGAREIFLEEGMNDFVPKPIELPVMVDKLKTWLPVEKIKRMVANTSDMVKKDKINQLKIGNLETKEAIRLLGSEKLYWSVLEDYYKVIEKKALLIKDLEQKEDWPAYTIEVHALKSASRQIGATGLSKKAAALEEAGNARDKEIIHRDTDEMLVEYCNYISLLKPYFEKSKDEDEISNQLLITREQLLAFFDELEEAVDNLDMDSMEGILTSMKGFSYEENQQTLFEQLSDAIDCIDVDACGDIMEEWKQIIE